MQSNFKKHYPRGKTDIGGEQLDYAWKDNNMYYVYKARIIKEREEKEY